MMARPPNAFIVYGKPEPQGSKRIGRHGSRFVVLNDNDKTLKVWRVLVSNEARRVARPVGPLDGSLLLWATFSLARPRTVPLARQRPNVKPDLSKLVRAIEDALTDGGFWVDDARVTVTFAQKVYVGELGSLDRPGVEIGVLAL